MQCHVCRADTPADARFCPTCGVELDAAIMRSTERLDQPQQPALQRALPEGVCPKCGSADIYVDNAGLVDARGGYTVLSLHDIWHGRTAPVSTYLCAACGYLELFLADTNQIPDIVKTWRRLM
jgi:RNA polymerase subunit RPABC4/transcription elongation factor Spt4